jgi:uncharacterized membrane protein YccC
MLMNPGSLRASVRSGANGRDITQILARIVDALRSVAPALLFGLRLWTAVCLALYIAFWLQLDNAFWAGTSAAIVCQPSLGASLRKAWFRMIGTTVGATVIVILTAWFPQARDSFLLGLALWCAACGLLATLLRNFAAYAAALAGITAAIIASDELGAVGGANGDAFILAVARASEICIGITCAGVVLAGTDFGAARQRLALLIATISAEIVGGLARTFLLVGPEQSKTRPARRDLVRRVGELDPVIDEALGESSDLRPHSPTLQAAVEGLVAALSGWRTVAFHLELSRGDRIRRQADIVLENIPTELRSLSEPAQAASWTADPSRGRKACAMTVRTLTGLPADTPSLRLLADRTAEALIGIRCALNGLVLLVDPVRNVLESRSAWFRVPDLLPAFVNAMRIFVTIGVAELFWIATAWPSGAQAVVFAAIAVIMFSPRADQAYTITIGLMSGACVAAVLAAIVKFAILPEVETFAGFSIVLGVVLVPIGMLVFQRQTPVFVAMTVFLLPLIAPANQMSYDTQQFYNAALAIITGIGIAAVSFRLLPPLSPDLRTRRLLALTLRDLRHLAAAPTRWTVNGWESRLYGRLSALPGQAEPQQFAQLLAALSLGTEIIRLHRLARRFGHEAELDAVLGALARGERSTVNQGLDLLDKRLAAVPATRPGAKVRLRARSSILGMSEVLNQYAAYFGFGAAR